MTSKEFLADLLKPIPGDNPCGQPLRYSGTYDLIQTARLEEDASLPTGVWERDFKEANWKEVEEVSLIALKSKSKDLQIAAWLCEAWVHLKGISGFIEGVKLILQLVENFWESLYPQLDEEMEYRMSPLFWMNEKLTHRLQSFPLSAANDAKVKTVYVYDWIKAQKKPNAALQKTIEHGIENTSREYFVTLQKDTQQALKLTNQLQKILLLKTKAAEGALYKLNNIMQEISHFTKFALTHLPEEKPLILDTSYEQPLPEASMIPSSKPILSKGVFENRDQAYEALEKIALYLEHQEPHSPTPYLIRRAVSWGNMTLAELIQEFSNDPSGLNQLTKLLGLDQTKPKSSSLPQSTPAE